MSNDHVYFQSNQLGRKGGNALELSIGEAPLDDQISPFDVAEIAHPVRKGVIPRIRIVGSRARTRGEESDSVYPGLLTMRSKGPGKRRATEPNQEIASPHSTLPE